MKKAVSVLAVCCLTAALFTGCSDAKPVNETAFPLSGVVDVTDSSGVRAYVMKATDTDTYHFTSEDTTEIAISQNGKKLASGQSEATADLQKGETYTVSVKTAHGGDAFSLQAEAETAVHLPFDVVSTPEDFQLTECGETTTISYQKRDGGTYIYSNNPEQVPPEDVGHAFIRNEGLTGSVFFTFEHANYSGTPFYLGYQLKNDGDTDVYITVENVGFQASGTWFGLYAWADYYNTHYTLPDGYLVNGSIASKYASFDYAYSDYTPRVYQPTTYCLPAGEYFYVLGGTSEDAYNHYNVDNSADKKIMTQKCANGAVKFYVTGGSVTGTMYCYDDVKQVQAEPEAQGYVCDRSGRDYSPQYIGKADHEGVIDGFFSFTFDDSTQKGRLPVSYTTRYADDLPTSAKPYQAYNSSDHEIQNAQLWMTHINPQNNHLAIGTDLVEFSCNDENGKEIVVDNDHADGGGNPANTANWMIEYQEHYILQNEGDTQRKVSIGAKDHGSLYVIVRDENGAVLDTAVTIGLANTKGTSDYKYTVKVPAHSTKTVTVSYVLAPCAYGTVSHFVSLAN